MRYEMRSSRQKFPCPSIRAVAPVYVLTADKETSVCYLKWAYLTITHRSEKCVHRTFFKKKEHRIVFRVDIFRTYRLTVNHFIWTFGGNVKTNYNKTKLGNNNNYTLIRLRNKFSEYRLYTKSKHFYLSTRTDIIPTNYSIVIWWTILRSKSMTLWDGEHFMIYWVMCAHVFNSIKRSRR